MHVATTNQFAGVGEKGWLAAGKEEEGVLERMSSGTVLLLLFICSQKH